jgi:hypothetical protein
MPEGTWPKPKLPELNPKPPSPGDDTTMTIRRQTLTRDEWQTITARCRAVRDSLHQLVAEFPETPGVTPATIDYAVKAYSDFVTAMIGLETPIVQQEAATDNDVIRFVQGDSGPILGPTRGRVAKDAPNLTKDQWIALGNEIKRIRTEASAIGAAIQTTKGVTKAISGKFAKSCDLQPLKIRLDGIVRGQHPAWKEAIKVFYGPPLDPPRITRESGL